MARLCKRGTPHRERAVRSHVTHRGVLIAYGQRAKTDTGRDWRRGREGGRERGEREKREGERVREERRERSARRVPGDVWHRPEPSGVR